MIITFGLCNLGSRGDDSLGLVQRRPNCSFTRRANVNISADINIKTLQCYPCPRTTGHQGLDQAPVPWIPSPWTTCWPTAAAIISCSGQNMQSLHQPHVSRLLILSGFLCAGLHGMTEHNSMDRYCYRVMDEEKTCVSCVRRVSSRKKRAVYPALCDMFRSCVTFPSVLPPCRRSLEVIGEKGH